MHYRLLLLLAIATPALAAKKPPPLPPLPPLLLDMAAPLVVVTIDGKPLRLRVDSAGTRHVELNASAARRLDLANPARLVAGKPVEFGQALIEVGKESVREVTSDAIARYQDREVKLPLAWSERDHVAGADGMIGPQFLPHDSVRWRRRPLAPGDAAVMLPMQWKGGRGLLGTVAAGKRDIDVQLAPFTAETIVTAAAASHLSEAFGGRFDGPAREAVISMGVRRPVRDVVFDRPVMVAGVPVKRAAARLFDWSGKTSLPSDPAAADEIVVRGRFDAQRQWPKLALGNDLLAACAEIGWTRLPLAMTLTCPRG